MPHVTDRQADSKAILDTYVAHLLAKIMLDFNDDVLAMDINTSDSDSDSDSSTSDIDLEDEDPVGEGLVMSLTNLYQNRYQQECRTIPKTLENLRLLLNDYRYNFPDIFRSYMRVTPSCFNSLVEILCTHPVFSNNSHNVQMPVEDQVAIALYRFGHYRNAASYIKVALWAGVSWGTVGNVTMRVLTALCDPCFQAVTMLWPNADDIEAAKCWVEEQSCPAWRNGWLMVDGTLVPIFQRPAHYGNTYYDCKSNYSFNVQVSFQISEILREPT